MQNDKQDGTESQDFDINGLESDDQAFEKLFSIEALRKTWNNLRRELRETTSRDVIDWADWALVISSSLPDIQETILKGEYTASRVTRFEMGKSNGAYRVITSMSVRDTLVYRHICDHALELALPRKVKGAYFSRRHSLTPIGNSFEPNDNPSDQFYAIWLRYNEYRTRTLLNEPFQILVVTDISNYFDSIQHDLLFEYLAPLGLPRKAVGLLGRLLEAFRPESGHSPSPRVGLPVDETDCSRELAHIFLFEHDRRIVNEFGEMNFVRWMDDQNVGVRSRSEGRRVINLMNRSLNQQRLTLNSGKTTFLTPGEVATHFQLDANEALSKWLSQLEAQKWQMNRGLEQKLFELWLEYSQGSSANQGNWDKILKRFYGYATRANMEFLEYRALNDLIRYPHLDDRIFTYFARRNRGDELLILFERYAHNQENLFDSTERQFFESLLLLDVDQDIADKCRHIAYTFAKGEYPNQTGRPLGRAAAMLCLYWFGEDEQKLQQIYDSAAEVSHLPKEVARAWLACIAARNPMLLDNPINKLFGHTSDDVLRIVRFIQGILEGHVSNLGPYKSQKPRYPLPYKFYDARAWLLLELASHTVNEKLRNTLRKDYSSFHKLIYTNQEREIANRVNSRLEMEPA